MTDTDKKEKTYEYDWDTIGFIDVEDIQDKDDSYWNCTLDGLLGMTDQIIRFYGDNETLFKEMIGDFMWEVVVRNLSADTDARHDGEYERCGGFPKFAGEPGISHLIAEYKPRHNPLVPSEDNISSSD